MRLAIAFAAATFAATPALAEFTSVESTRPVPETMDALVSAVENAGATVFARVDHAQGAAGEGMNLPPAQLLVFGNPKLGTPAMQADPRAGVILPLRVLVYEDASGKVMLTHESVDTMFDDTDVPADAEYVGKMEDALSKLTASAAGGS